MSLLPADTQLAILASQKPGHANQCAGVARALGIQPDVRPVRPRWAFRLTAPWGPPDVRDKRNDPVAALRQPYPDIALASGRETVPYLRTLKRLSGGKTFCVYLGDPRISHATFDLIALPEHDRYRGENVLATLTPPHPHDAAALQAAAARPDPRITSLPAPRIAMLIGGPNATYKFLPGDMETLHSIATTVLQADASLMITCSRRTPPELQNRLQSLTRSAGDRCFVWDGSGANPYIAMLALADAFIVTADSVSMIAECISTGKPVQMYEPAGTAGKFAHLISELRRRDAIRPWMGKLESWRYDPIDSTPVIAAEIAQRYIAARR